MGQTVTWSCDCGNAEVVDTEAIKAHLSEAHGVTETMGQVTPVMHLDGPETALNVYRWEVGGVILRQSVVVEREPGDQMRERS